MRFWRFVVSALCVPLSLLIAFSGVSIDASASVTYTPIQRDVGIDIFGAQIPYTCTHNGVISTGSFTLTDYTFYSCSSINVAPNDVIYSANDAENYVWLFYETNAFNGQGFADLVLDVSAVYSDSAYGCFAMSYSGISSNSVTSSDNLISSYPNNGFNNIAAISANTSVSSSLSDYYGVFRLDYNTPPSGSTWFNMRPILYNFSGGQTISSISFQHVKSYTDGYFLFAIALPYVAGTVTNGSSVTTTVTSSGDINVNVDVDMSETNGLLDSILDALSAIVNGIRDLFVPSEQWLDDWLQAMADALEDAFGDIPALHDQLETAIQNLINNSAVQTLHFDGVSPPGVGQVIAPRDVPLKPSGFESLYSFVRIAVNLVATIAVINMLLNKFKAVLVGEVVVDHGD